MTRKNIQNITLEKKSNTQKDNNDFLTAEDIKVKSTYSKDDLKDVDVPNTLYL